jgi:hypothetical protein
VYVKVKVVTASGQVPVVLNVKDKHLEHFPIESSKYYCIVHMLLIVVTNFKKEETLMIIIRKKICQAVLHLSANNQL